MQPINIKKKQKYIILIKIAIAITCLYLLIDKIDFNQLTNAFSGIKNISPLLVVMLLFSIVALQIFNILIETTKWRILVYQYQISNVDALKQVLAGIAGGFISPNRIGDPIARCYLLPTKFRVRGLLPASLCSFSQLLATAIFGSIALMRISNENLPSIPRLAMTQFILVILIGALIWIAMKFFENRLGHIRLSKVLVVVGLSLIRYFVFCMELWLIFLLLSPSVKFEPMFFAISLTFLINSIIPSFPITELGVKAAGAAVFFPLFSIDATIAITATMLLWFINVALPAIPGIIILTSHGITIQGIKDFRNQILKKEIEEGSNVIA